MKKETKSFEKKEHMAKNMPSDSQMRREIKENSKRISENKNHPIMKQEEAHKRMERRD